MSRLDLGPLKRFPLAGGLQLQVLPANAVFCAGSTCPLTLYFVWTQAADYETSETSTSVLDGRMLRAPATTSFMIKATYWWNRRLQTSLAVGGARHSVEGSWP